MARGWDIFAGFAIGVGITTLLATWRDWKREQEPIFLHPVEAPAAPPARASPDLAPSPPKAEACDPAPVRTLPPRPLSNETLPAFEAGTAVLRIGDGYVFGEDHARSADDKAGVDVVCADISGVPDAAMSERRGVDGHPSRRARNSRTRVGLGDPRRGRAARSS